MDGGGIWECQACLVHLDFFPLRILRLPAAKSSGGSYGWRFRHRDFPQKRCIVWVGIWYTLKGIQICPDRIQDLHGTLHESYDLGDGKNQSIHPEKSDLGSGFLGKRCFKYKTRWWQLKDFFMFTPNFWGRWTQFDEHIFQGGWFNHQLENHVPWRIPWDCQIYQPGFPSHGDYIWRSFPEKFQWKQPGHSTGFGRYFDPIGSGGSHLLQVPWTSKTYIFKRVFMV